MPLADVSFVKSALPKDGVVVILAGAEGALGAHATAIDAATGGHVARAIKTAAFKGKGGSTLDIIATGPFDRVIVAGLDGVTAEDFTKLGGVIAGKLGEAKAKTATLLLERPDGTAIEAEQAAHVALGTVLRSYVFDRYKTKKKDEDEAAAQGLKLAIALDGHAAAKKAWGQVEPIAEGVVMARELVNEPANVLGSVEFAKKAEALEKLGVEVEVLTEKEMKKLGMHALLGVNQGSVRPPRLAIMRWNGGKAGDKPIAFIGKGVVFDTGGISIKPAASMEDMKGDMAGAACVVGLMHALAGRKAKANVIGAIGLVENMPDGNAQRPGDIVTSMSGQTIEIINTDAEGRLVLADVLWHIQDKYKPAFMINLATLTGAILVALGNHHAGLFSNNDELSERLSAAGQATGEWVWRLPMGSDYDKLIDTKNADMKNTGGRYAGSITAAQFLQRFVNGVPWAHLDIAGTAMGSPQTEINRSWSSGWGVRLLDRLVKDHYEG
jgi:leucyl aminopeptidase